jgi:hypothetical protein
MPAVPPPEVKCPVCGYSPCEVLEVGTEPEGPSTNGAAKRPSILARCPKCKAEFRITPMGK